MKRENLVLGKNECESCIEGKVGKKSHRRLEEIRTKQTMELWYTDLISPIKPSTHGNKNYILTVIDDFSRMVFIRLLNEKSEVAEKIKRFVTIKENQTEVKLKRIRSDNDGKFLEKTLKNWVEEKGIVHELSR